MEREKLILGVLGIVLLVAALQAYQLSGLVGNAKAAATGSLASVGGAQTSFAASGTSQQPQALPSSAPRQVGGC